jgi:hypothetical protein
MLSVRITILAPLVLTLFVLILPSSQEQRGRRYRVEVHNHSRVVIDRIYMSRSSESSWGEDRMGSEVLHPGHYLPIENVIPGEYDFLFIDEDEEKCMRRDVKVFEDREVEITDDWLAANCKAD